MKTIFDKLFDGEIFPAEQIISRDPEYRPLGKQLGEQFESLKNMLPREEADRLQDLDDNYNKMSSITDFASFSYGLRLGVLLMFEVFAGEDEIAREVRKEVRGQRPSCAGPECVRNVLLPSYLYHRVGFNTILPIKSV